MASPSKELIEELRNYPVGEESEPAVRLMMEALARLLELHLFWSKGGADTQ